MSVWMKMKLFFAICAFMFTSASGHATEWGFRVVDGKLVDAASGTPFILQGVSHAHTWFKPLTSQALVDISAKHANTVRIVLSNGCRWSRDEKATLAEVLSLAKANRLVAVAEVHDSTGYGEDPAACPMDTAVQYWLDMKDVLMGQEAFVLINIANEPFGNVANMTAWADATRYALVRLRGGGITHTLMVDAPNWGQDWAGEMRTHARELFAADPLRNTVFSVHMYEAYIDAYAAAGLPLVVGEFAREHAGKPVAAAAVMKLAKQRANGWSWSGNGGTDAPLDLVFNFNATLPTSWGDMVFADLVTSRPCPVFS